MNLSKKDQEKSEKLEASIVLLPCPQSLVPGHVWVAGEVLHSC